MDVYFSLDALEADYVALEGHAKKIISQLQVAIKNKWSDYLGSLDAGALLVYPAGTSNIGDDKTKSLGRLESVPGTSENALLIVLSPDYFKRHYQHGESDRVGLLATFVSFHFICFF
jgi:hypothetical protein